MHDLCQHICHTHSATPTISLQHAQQEDEFDDDDDDDDDSPPGSTAKAGDDHEDWEEVQVTDGVDFVGQGVLLYDFAGKRVVVCASVCVCGGEGTAGKRVVVCASVCVCGGGGGDCR